MFVFTKIALKKFQKFDVQTQNFLKEKLIEIVESNHILQIRPLVNLYPATHRLRVGDYRLILQWDADHENYIVLDIGHRKDIYR